MCICVYICMTAPTPGQLNLLCSTNLPLPKRRLATHDILMRSTRWVPATSGSIGELRGLIPRLAYAPKPCFQSAITTFSLALRRDWIDGFSDEVIHLSTYYDQAGEEVSWWRTRQRGKILHQSRNAESEMNRCQWKSSSKRKSSSLIPPPNFADLKEEGSDKNLLYPNSNGQFDFLCRPLRRQ